MFPDCSCGNTVTLAIPELTMLPVSDIVVFLRKKVVVNKELLNPRFCPVAPDIGEKFILSVLDNH